jgi:glycosyltransferase involved in cell wall biosynthesis
MLISVLTPTRNRPGYLRDNLQSVAASVLPADWRLEQVICDDGSKVAAAEATRALVAQFPHARLIRHAAQMGVAATRNTAARLCEGEVLLDLDDDDFLPRDSIIRRVGALLESDALWSFGGLAIVGSSGRVRIGREQVLLTPPADWFTAFLEGEVFAWPGTRTYRREALQLAGGWDPALRIAEDFDHWLRLTRYAGDPLLYPGLLAYYRKKAHGLAAEAFRDGSVVAILAQIRAAWRRDNSPTPIVIWPSDEH